MSLIGDQFSGLPMHDLIGGPLMAACDAQIKLANATATFIQTVGFLPPGQNGGSDIRTVKFAFDRPTAALPATASGQAADSTVDTERVELEIPLLAIVKVPSLSINTVDIVFDMEVKNSESHEDSSQQSGTMNAEMNAGWGPFSVKVSMSGSMSASQANTRKSDQSAKYHVEVHARDDGMPEGLARVFDIIQSSIAPRSVSKNTGTPKLIQPAKKMTEPTTAPSHG
jgi:hypothetical protein